MAPKESSPIPTPSWERRGLSSLVNKKMNKRDPDLMLGIALSLSCVGKTRREIENTPDEKSHGSRKRSKREVMASWQADATKYLDAFKDEALNQTYLQYKKQRLDKLLYRKRVSDMGRVFMANAAVEVWGKLGERIFQTLSKFDKSYQSTSTPVFLNDNILWDAVLRYEIQSISDTTRGSSNKRYEISDAKKFQKLIHRRFLKARMIVDESRYPEDPKSFKFSTVLASSSSPIIVTYSRNTRNLRARFKSLITFGDDTLVG